MNEGYIMKHSVILYIFNTIFFTITLINIKILLKYTYDKMKFREEGHYIQGAKNIYVMRI